MSYIFSCVAIKFKLWWIEFFQVATLLRNCEYIKVGLFLSFDSDRHSFFNRIF